MFLLLVWWPKEKREELVVILLESNGESVCWVQASPGVKHASNILGIFETFLEEVQISEGCCSCRISARAPRTAISENPLNLVTKFIVCVDDLDIRIPLSSLEGLRPFD